MAIKRILNNLINRKFLDEIQDFMNRIPKDIFTWAKEIERLKDSKNKTNKLQVKEYNQLLDFHNGKILAYLHVFQELNDGKLRLTKEMDKIVRLLVKNHNKHYLNYGNKIKLK